jgi:hypothetical protein
MCNGFTWIMLEKGQKNEGNLTDLHSFGGYALQSLEKS